MEQKKRTRCSNSYNKKSIFISYLGVPLNDWPRFNLDTERQLVIRNTEKDADVTLEPVQIPLPSKRAVSHWQKLAGSNAVQPLLYTPLILSLLFAF